ncbi:PREDICTED: uncharacterized protein LOC106817616 [Priapulus caudatus]|uniref:Uncharacterized protein LOC106817616 n=1 Tax=Priapulus caudatus TaxID=37621 RepID=A0ABM1F009_PRICU|nr:PREDICTED: uncharacterized protein LOC106817616 [Priapulus caudatus]
MSDCHKCKKPVYFAERRTSLGFDWHPECLRCEECSKRLNPGQHAEHKGIPYCNMPCYSTLFGPAAFGYGFKTEAHMSYSKRELNPSSPLKTDEILVKLKAYNAYYEGKAGQITHRNRNGRCILEGILKIYWGVSRLIFLREKDNVPLSSFRRGRRLTARRQRRRRAYHRAQWCRRRRRSGRAETRERRKRGATGRRGSRHQRRGGVAGSEQPLPDDPSTPRPELASL